VPYLGAEPGVVQRWSERLDAAAHSSGLRVGIAWAGKQTHGRDNQRSLSLSQLNPVLSVRGICPVSLQKVARAEDAGADVSVRPMDFSSEMENFAETAALIQNLDLVITIDSSMAHLAGALGKPAWVMLPYIPDWRWCRDRDDSPWYPTARLFRQDASRSWDQVIERVAGELPSMVRNSARRGRSKAG
jgi:hypothetical protein